MAVVQISKIQHRRGRINSGSGLPQLASGEIGWAIDSQELFIGNGSVSEGAPYVGNTKIITEHDNILDLALQYQYKRNDATIQTGETSSTPIQRTIQERLDDIVSAKSFGAEGDGSTDDTLALQRAIDQLYLNDATKGSTSSRIQLNIEAGEYLISQPLRIPPYANIVGAGKDKTIIRQTGNFPVAYTVNSDSTPGAYKDLVDLTSLNQPEYITLANMTLEQTVSGYPALELISCKSSYFANLKIKGPWTYPSDPIGTDDVGIRLLALSYSVTCKDNVINQIDFINVGCAIESDYDIENNSIQSCNFYDCGKGIKYGGTIDGITAGKLYGPSNNKVVHSNFYRITEIGFEVIHGTGNRSESNLFRLVGNDGGSEETATHNIIKFHVGGNVSTNDHFERSCELTSKPAYINDIPYIGEVGGVIKSEHKYNEPVYILANQVGSTFIRLPAETNVSHVIHYFYKSDAQQVTRQGTLYVNVDRHTDTVHLTDDCNATGDSDNVEKLSFSVTLENADIATGDTEIDTVYVRYTNSAASEDGYINYWYETLS